MAEATSVIPRGVKKAVYVVFDDENAVLPSFEFVGVWTGFDISTVVSNLRRAYARVKRDQRRADSSETRSVSTKGESE